MTGGLSLPLADWLERYTARVTEAFGERVWFLGLQGSRARGEGAEASDLDTVLILDTLSAEDLTRYGALLDTLPDREKICGFVSGKAELFAWEASELFQFCHDTCPLIGSLDAVLARVTSADVCRALRIGAGQVYHLCAHNLVHARDPGLLREAYKTAFFALRAASYLQTGRYTSTLEALRPQLEGLDRAVLDAGLALNEQAGIGQAELQRASALLLDWASACLRRCAGADGA